ncbi:hypothetical protein HWV62_37627 [Athelia sp. TMB]|nr:hypothetical protein HWV62_37627 [Athelia sp. TMB]
MVRSSDGGNADAAAQELHQQMEEEIDLVDLDTFLEVSDRGSPTPGEEQFFYPIRQASAASKSAQAEPNTMFGEVFGNNDQAPFFDPMSSGSEEEFEPTSPTHSSNNGSGSDDDGDDANDTIDTSKPLDRQSAAAGRSRKQKKAKVDKGKQRAQGERPSGTVQPRGRLSTAENQELEALGLKFKGDLEDAAKKWALTTRPHCKDTHGDDPDEVNKLLAEHQAIQQGAGKPVTAHDIEKHVKDAATQFGHFSKNYLVGYNIAVVGAIIHLGPELVLSLFGASLVSRAKSILMLHEDKARDKPEAAISHTITPSDTFWKVSSTPRDDWPSVALANRLVLVGWGSNILQVPNTSWVSQSTGGLHLMHYKALLGRVPNTWHNIEKEKLIQYPEDEYGLAVISLDDFLKDPEEYSGRHPCVTDHKGHVLWFADEDKAGLAGRKSIKSSRGGKGHSHSRKVPARKGSASDEDFDGSGEDSSYDFPANVNFRVGGGLSPSGKVMKHVKDVLNIPNCLVLTLVIIEQIPQLYGDSAPVICSVAVVIVDNTVIVWTLSSSKKHSLDIHAGPLVIRDDPLVIHNGPLVIHDGPLVIH